MYCRTFVLLLVMMNDAIQCLILLFDYDNDEHISRKHQSKYTRVSTVAKLQLLS